MREPTFKKIITLLLIDDIISISELPKKILENETTTKEHLKKLFTYNMIKIRENEEFNTTEILLNTDYKNILKNALDLIK